MVDDVVERKLATLPATAERFAAFGQIVRPRPDGGSFGPEDAQLDLSQGIPRFYAMRLRDRGQRFHEITRHRRVTQCLGAMGGRDWLLAVAPPHGLDDPEALPSPADIRGFRIPGDHIIKLAKGTWHAGPFFDGAEMDFYNLELADTNETDHHTVDLKAVFGLEFVLAG